jgi:hypothetical protein
VSSRRGPSSLWALLGYAALAFAYLGLRPLVESGHQYVGGGGGDPQIFIWSFAWWPHAIAHGENPFVTHAIWAPSGVNLTWTTAVPGLALLFAPLTLVAGPVVSYDTAAVLLPAVAAWTAFLLCRHLTRSYWAALVGGYLFGFSAYMLAQTEGHTNLTAVFLLPLVALVFARYLEGELTGRGMVARLAPLLALQVLISTELTLTLTLAVAVGLVVGTLVAPARRRRIGVSGLLFAAALGIAAILVAPFDYYVVTNFQSGSINLPSVYTADLANLIVPTKLALASVGWAESIANRFPGGGAEQGAYLGPIALLLFLIFCWSQRRRPLGRFLFAVFLIAVFLSLGDKLSVAGYDVLGLPWKLVEGAPLLDNVLPIRLVLYASLAVAVAVALWTSSQRDGWLRYALPALAVIALIPNPWAGVWATNFTVPAFFTADRFRTCFDPGSTILPIPVRGDSDSMLWQAVDDFRFRMAAGHIGPKPPHSFFHSAADDVIGGGNFVTPDLRSFVTQFVAEKGITSIVVDQREAANWSSTLNPLYSPRPVGGVVLYQVGAFPPACAA